MPTLYVRAFRSSLFGTLLMAALLFLPAGTLNYWQAWVFMTVVVSASGAVTVYLAIHDPKLLDRRMRAGPTAEKESSQKFIVFLAMMGFLLLLVVPAFDHRYGWSRVPTYVCLIGDALIAIESGGNPEDPKLKALVSLTRELVSRRGYVGRETIRFFFDAGYKKEQLLEVLIGIGIKTISTYFDHIVASEMDDEFKRMISSEA